MELLPCSQSVKKANQKSTGFALIEHFRFRYVIPWQYNQDGISVQTLVRRGRHTHSTTYTHYFKFSLRDCNNKPRTVTYITGTCRESKNRSLQMLVCNKKNQGKPEFYMDLQDQALRDISADKKHILKAYADVITYCNRIVVKEQVPGKKPPIELIKTIPVTFYNPHSQVYDFWVHAIPPLASPKVEFTPLSRGGVTDMYRILMHLASSVTK